MHHRLFWPAVGVEHEAEPGEGEGGSEAPGDGGVMGRALQAVEDLMRNSYYSTSILVALFMLREHILYFSLIILFFVCVWGVLLGNWGQKGGCLRRQRHEQADGHQLFLPGCSPSVCLKLLAQTLLTCVCDGVPGIPNPLTIP